MDEYDDSIPSPLRTALTVLLIVLVPLALGIFLAGRLLPRPQVGIIRLSYDIGSLSTYEIAEQLRVARENPAIQAVVVIINSPGGSAAFSEELFLDVLDTRRDLPVVASIDLLAASGAYYMAAAANEIYAKPTSAVGSSRPPSLSKSLYPSWLSKCRRSLLTAGCDTLSADAAAVRVRLRIMARKTSSCRAFIRRHNQKF